ncbi:MAG: AAA family ATPase [Mycoplasma sp.]|nr:AAA family ATPase [Mycoplasma sp.]
MNNLANDLRPKKLEDIIGQKHIIPFLKKIIIKKATTSILFYGKPGIGKTTISKILANELGLPFMMFNAAKDSKSDLVKIISNYDVIIIDEIHRLNKDKQDILLSYIENSNIIVYATTTENPYRIINPAVRSRMHILALESINEEDITEGIQHIIKKYNLDIKIDKENLNSISKIASGDFRSALNIIDLIERFYPTETITKEMIKEVLPSINFYSDKSGDVHYDLLSAFHKSLRGSNIDAVLYYGILIAESGDIQGLFRRMLAVCYEDIGLANPGMGIKLEASIKAIERLGFPEAYNPLSFILIELANSPKSNSSYLAKNKVLEKIKEGHVYEVPSHLKDKSYRYSSTFNDDEYKYPHNFKNNWIDQQYLPNEIKDEKFYKHQKNSNEIKYFEYWKEIKK